MLGYRACRVDQDPNYQLHYVSVEATLEDGKVLNNSGFIERVS
jgi:hypothetical protein